MPKQRLFTVYHDAVLPAREISNWLDDKYEMKLLSEYIYFTSL